MIWWAFSYETPGKTRRAPILADYTERMDCAASRTPVAHLAQGFQQSELHSEISVFRWLAVNLQDSLESLGIDPYSFFRKFSGMLLHFCKTRLISVSWSLVQQFDHGLSCLFFL